mmetsp:Transcript_27269/g.53166  ORF Transcript_27269/g.53166 Transcript_27269/m.53166 type:complete len:239 (+) Transcript_27269:675-1391(+)
MRSSCSWSANFSWYAGCTLVMYMPHMANTASICRPMASRQVPSQLCGLRCLTSARTLSNASATCARNTSTKLAELLIRITPLCVRSITRWSAPAAESAESVLLRVEASEERDVEASGVRRSRRSTVPSPPLTTASEVHPTSDRCAPSESVPCAHSCAALKMTSAARYVAGWSLLKRRALTLSNTSSMVICSSARFFVSASAAQKSLKPLCSTLLPHSLSRRCSSSLRKGSKYDCNTRS